MNFIICAIKILNYITDIFTFLFQRSSIKAEIALNMHHDKINITLKERTKELERNKRKNIRNAGTNYQQS